MKVSSKRMATIAGRLLREAEFEHHRGQGHCICSVSDIRSLRGSVLSQREGRTERKAKPKARGKK